jgi:four helix bundle protein
VRGKIRPMTIKSFRDLEVYQEALDLAIEIDKLLKTFPKDEKFLLVDQMKRASRGIAPLIAEGYAKRESIKEFRKFVRTALAEANEMTTHLELASRLGYIKDQALTTSLIERYDVLGKKLSNLKANWQNF